MHCVEKWNKPESEFQGTQVIEQFRTHKGTTRKLLGGADTTILMVSKGVPVGSGGAFIAGAAYSAFWLPVGWAAKQGQTWVTFAHEVGHMFSADHDQVRIEQKIPCQ